MQQEVLVKYYTELDYVFGFEEELKQMHPEDLEFVLNIILPENIDKTLTIKELNQRWMK
jgi:hypothetical protein